MQKPRPKEAAAPRQHRPTRDNSGSHEGASAPFLIPRRTQRQILLTEAAGVGQQDEVTWLGRSGGRR